MKYLTGGPWVVMAAVFACVLGTVGCGEKTDPPGEGGGEVAEVDLDGPSLYQAQCAMCHGVTGDGNGIVVMDRPARSFKKGAFSFGNTPEALFKTISNGIGGTPMPGFKEILSEAQCRILADYVIELGPEPITVQPGQSEYRVVDKPLVIRGGLPPIADGLAPVTRGLLVGGTDGLTFEYNTKPLVLLGVRQGGFADRKDWGGRGGAELQPLGVVSHLVDGGGSSFMWSMFVSSDTVDPWVPIRAHLVATTVSDGVAWVEYKWPGTARNGSGSSPPPIRESGQAITLAGWPGYRRTFEASGDSAFGFMQLVQLHESKISVVAVGKAGRLLRRRTDDPLPTYFLEHTATSSNNVSTLLVDTLYGLKPTEENLKGLKELVQ